MKTDFFWGKVPIQSFMFSSLQGVVELAKEQGKLLVIDAVKYCPQHTCAYMANGRNT